ncbi:MAG: SDR family NAD(P)-dependent oxidoreductase [Pyrinomonadaceae bacterium]|nr:SDR family NAD(P)-dependent oxidoreductase [Pyrinomonadaceae bacterium]
MKKVWFITGSSTGFGRELAEKALEQGYSVVATARRPEVLLDLIEKYPNTARAVRLDVTDTAEVKAAVEMAIRAFGRIDVLVNNAGYGLMGAIEELSGEQIKKQFDTNLFGAINVIQAALPHLRGQKSGHILNYSSVAGFVAFPSTGIYCATKFALEAVSESLAAELGSHNIKVTIVEPGAFRTDFSGRSLHTPDQPLDKEYPSTAAFIGWLKENESKMPGDPRKAAQAVIEIVESKNPPLRLPLGEDSITTIENELEKVRQDIAPWRELGVNTAFEGMTAGAIGG